MPNYSRVFSLSFAALIASCGTVPKAPRTELCVFSSYSLKNICIWSDSTEFSRDVPAESMNGYISLSPDDWNKYQTWIDELERIIRLSCKVNATSSVERQALTQALTRTP